MREKRAKVLYDNNEQVCFLLADLTCTIVAASLKSREAHWNVKGSDFGPLHDLFGDIYDYLNDVTDTVAERVSQLGGTPGSLKAWTPEVLAGDGPATLSKMADILAEVVGQAIKITTLVSASGDKTSEDILIELVRETEKWLWKVESHLQTYNQV